MVSWLDNPCALRLPSVIEIFRQGALASVKQLVTEERGDVPSALEMLALAARLMQRKQRLEQVHMRVLTTGRRRSDVALAEAALRVRPALFRPCHCRFGGADEVGAVAQRTRRFGQSERDEGEVVE